MVSGRPVELTSTLKSCLGRAGFWSGREAHVQRLRQRLENQVLERTMMHCEESGGRQREELTLKKESTVLADESFQVFLNSAVIRMSSYVLMVWLFWY